MQRDQFGLAECMKGLEVHPACVLVIPVLLLSLPEAGWLHYPLWAPLLSSARSEQADWRKACDKTGYPTEGSVVCSKCKQTWGRWPLRQRHLDVGGKGEQYLLKSLILLLELQERERTPKLDTAWTHYGLPTPSDREIAQLVCGGWLGGSAPPHQWALNNLHDKIACLLKLDCWNEISLEWPETVFKKCRSSPGSSPQNKILCSAQRQHVRTLKLIVWLMPCSCWSLGSSKTQVSATTTTPRFGRNFSGFNVSYHLGFLFWTSCYIQ